MRTSFGFHLRECMGSSFPPTPPWFYPSTTLFSPAVMKGGGEGAGGPDLALPLLFYENPQTSPRIPFSFPMTHPMPSSLVPRALSQPGKAPWGQGGQTASRVVANQVETFCVFPNPALYFCQIPGPWNNFQDRIKTDPKACYTVGHGYKVYH